MTETKTPLNGTKTHPLKGASLDVLRSLAIRAIPRYEINPGIRDRLWREGLAEEFQPPQTHPRHYLPHVRITDAGRKRLAEIGQ